MSLNKITTLDVNDDFKNILTNVSTGNISATNANKLTTARAINLTGDITGSAVFDGTSDITITTVEKASGVTAGTYTKVTVDAKGNVTAGASITATDVGLGNVTNESKITMFTSPTFTGTPLAPTAAAGTNTTQIATTSFIANAVNAIQIGGRNLIPDSSFELGTWYTSSSGANCSVTYPLGNNSAKCIALTSTVDADRYVWLNIPIVPIGTYTLSYDVKCNTASQSIYTYADIRGSAGVYSNLNVPNPLPTSWTRISVPVNVTNADTTLSIILRAPLTIGGTIVYYDNFKLEKGNKATDYTPAPEDIQTQLDGKALAVHTHDDRYYTETEMNNKLSVLGSFVYGATLPDVSLRNANSLYFKITG